MPVRTEHARNVIRDSDRVAGAEPRVVHALPVGASGCRVIEVRVRVNEGRTTGERSFVSQSLDPVLVLKRYLSVASA